MQIRDRLHRSYSIISISVLIFMGVTIYLSTQQRISRTLHNELTQTNFLIYKMVENVFDINKEALLRHLNLFEKRIETVNLDNTRLLESDAEHHITQLTDYIRIETLFINNLQVFNSSDFVDHIAEITGGHASILQLVPHGLLRISTSIQRADGSRATQVYYPDNHEITETIRKGKIYIGKLYEMNRWYIVAFKPIFSKDRVIGAIQVGIEPDINALRKHILDIRIGRKGIPYIVDTEGILIISEQKEGENVYHLPHIKKMIRNGGDGLLVFSEGSSSPLLPASRIITTYSYHRELQWIIATGSYISEFYGELRFIPWIILLSAITALLIFIQVSRRLAESISNPLIMLTSYMTDLRTIQFDFTNFKLIDNIREKLSGLVIQEEEIRVLSETFAKMLVELEDAQRQQISRYRKLREIELIKKVDAQLNPDSEILNETDVSSEPDISVETAGDFFDISRGPEGQSWILIGFGKDDNVNTGIIMQLAQNLLNSLFRNIADISAEEAVLMLNNRFASLLNDIDDRLYFSILTASESGWLQYAGPEPDLMVYRNGQARFERISARTASVDADGLYSATIKLKEEDALIMDNLSAPELKSRKQSLYSSILAENWKESADEICIMLKKEIKMSLESSNSIFLLRRL